MKCFKASDLFDLKINGDFPLNIDFIVKSNETFNFKGPGIYFIYYKTDLVYIGSFYYSISNNDVRTQRWKKEIATITMRGFQVTMNGASNSVLDKSKNLKQIIRRPKGDFLTSLKRVDFADKNWSEFKGASFLSDFNIYWFPEEKKLNRSKKQLEQTTIQLREFYKPTCNG